MKKKALFILMLITVMITAMSMTACRKNDGPTEPPPTEPPTLEQYAIDNPDVQKSVDDAMKDSDVVVELKGNDVIYTFELSKMDGYTEDVAKDPTVVENLQKALDNAGPTFGGIAKSLETATKISGIHVVVNYTFDGEVVATQTFDSSQAPAEGESTEPEVKTPVDPDAEPEAESASDSE